MQRCTPRCYARHVNSSREKNREKRIEKKHDEEMAQLARAQQGSSSFRSPLSPTPPTDTTSSMSATIGPRIRKQKLTLDFMFAPRMAPGSQPSLEGMGWNKDKHDYANLALGEFFIYNNISFNAVRSPYWQIGIDVVATCGPGFKAPSAEELGGPILNQRVADVQVEIMEQREVWKKKGCTIMIDGWTDRRSRTLLNFLVSSLGKL